MVGGKVYFSKPKKSRTEPQRWNPGTLEPAVGLQSWANLFLSDSWDLRQLAG